MKNTPPEISPVSPPEKSGEIVVCMAMFYCVSLVPAVTSYRRVAQARQRAGESRSIIDFRACRLLLYARVGSATTV